MKNPIEFLKIICKWVTVGPINFLNTQEDSTQPHMIHTQEDLNPADFVGYLFYEVVPMVVKTSFLCFTMLFFFGEYYLTCFLSIVLTILEGINVLRYYIPFRIGVCVETYLPPIYLEIVAYNEFFVEYITKNPVDFIAILSFLVIIALGFFKGAIVAKLIAGFLGFLNLVGFIYYMSYFYRLDLITPQTLGMVLEEYKKRDDLITFIYKCYLFLSEAPTFTITMVYFILTFYIVIYHVGFHNERWKPISWLFKTRPMRYLQNVKSQVVGVVVFYKNFLKKFIISLNIQNNVFLFSQCMVKMTLLFLEKIKESFQSCIEKIKNQLLLLYRTLLNIIINVVKLIIFVIIFVYSCAFYPSYKDLTCAEFIEVVGLTAIDFLCSGVGICVCAIFGFLILAFVLVRNSSRKDELIEAIAIVVMILIIIFFES